jgi:hypothetical protein
LILLTPRVNDKVERSRRVNDQVSV